MRYRVLGPLRAGDAVITAGRDRVVLAMLLLHPNRVVGVHALIDAVWDQDPPATARTQLQMCVSRLRRALDARPDHDLPRGVRASRWPPTTWTPPPSIAWSPRPAAAPPRNRRAGCCGRPSISGRDRPSPAWTARRSAARRPRWTSGMRWPPRTGPTWSSPAGASSICRPSCPSGRTGSRCVSGCAASSCARLCRAGRPAEALAEYRRFRAVLHDELGIEPGARLQDLHRRILSGEVAVADAGNGDPDRPGAVACPDRRATSPAARSWPPVCWTTWPADGEGRSSRSSTGWPGVGKTALALHLAGPGRRPLSGRPPLHRPARAQRPGAGGPGGRPGHTAAAARRAEPERVPGRAGRPDRACGVASWPAGGA